MLVLLLLLGLLLRTQQVLRSNRCLRAEKLMLLMLLLLVLLLRTQQVHVDRRSLRQVCAHSNT